jgi:hypothetical protein
MLNEKVFQKKCDLKPFSNIKWWGEFITSSLALQEVLQKSFRLKENDTSWKSKYTQRP